MSRCRSQYPGSAPPPPEKRDNRYSGRSGAAGFYLRKWPGWTALSCSRSSDLKNDSARQFASAEAMNSRWSLPLQPSHAYNNCRMPARCWMRRDGDPGRRTHNHYSSIGSNDPGRTGKSCLLSLQRPCSCADSRKQGISEQVQDDPRANQSSMDRCGDLLTWRHIIFPAENCQL